MSDEVETPPVTVLPAPMTTPTLAEVTDLFCRLPLSTLFYRLEAIHLGDLLRIWVRAGERFIHN